MLWPLPAMILHLTTGKEHRPERRCRSMISSAEIVMILEGNREIISL